MRHMEPTPDLTFYLALHAKMRLDTTRYVAAVEATTEHDHRRRDALARWAHGFVDELLEHHQAEDTFLFPDLARRVPAARSTLDRLDADHRILDDLLERWQAAAAQVADRQTNFTESRAALLATSVDLRDHLATHLSVEDADIIPLFVRHYSVAEYEAVQGAAVQAARRQGVTFYVPWIVDALEGEARAKLLTEAPLPLKLVWYATRRRHARLVATVFAGVPDDVDAAISRPVPT
jgi:hemerythrin-like domain-containing protein